VQNAENPEDPLLKEYKFRWYLLGYSEKQKGKLILALDRIENVQKLSRRKFKPIQRH
jgi:hypothetical protein